MLQIYVRMVVSLLFLTFGSKKIMYVYIKQFNIAYD